MVRAGGFPTAALAWACLPLAPRALACPASRVRPPSPRPVPRRVLPVPCCPRPATRRCALTRVSLCCPRQCVLRARLSGCAGLCRPCVPRAPGSRVSWGGAWRSGSSFSEPISQGNSPHPQWVTTATLRGPPRDPHSCWADPLLGAPQPSVAAPHGWPPQATPHQTQLRPQSLSGGVTGGGAEPSGCSLRPVSPTPSTPCSQHFLS